MRSPTTPLRLLAAATLLTTALAGSLATAAPAGAAAPADDPAPTGRTVVDGFEDAGDVRVTSRPDVRNAVVPPRSIDIERLRYVLDFDRDRFVVRLRADDLVRPGRRNGFTTVQYVSLFFSYGTGRRAEEAFGMGMDSRRPDRNDLGAVAGVVSDSCFRSVRRARARMDYQADTVRIAVSLDCLPVGRRVSVSGDSSLYVNPAEPPNTQVARDGVASTTIQRLG